MSESESLGATASQSPVVEVPLRLEDPVAAITLGYRIGSATMPHGRTLVVTAAGSQVEVTISDVPGRVVIDLQAAIDQAAILLTA